MNSENIPENIDDKIAALKEMMNLGDNNNDGEIAYLRDTFLDAEKEYLAELLSIEKYREFVRQCNEYDGVFLCKEAQKLIDSIENGEVPEEKLEEIEARITILLVAIQDKVLRRTLTMRMSRGGR